MAVEIDGKWLPIFSLFIDGKGYYILEREVIKAFCPAGHLAPKADGRCLVVECPYYCGNPND